MAVATLIREVSQSIGWEEALAVLRDVNQKEAFQAGQNLSIELGRNGIDDWLRKWPNVGVVGNDGNQSGKRTEAEFPRWQNYIVCNIATNINIIFHSLSFLIDQSLVSEVKLFRSSSSESPSFISSVSVSV